MDSTIVITALPQKKRCFLKQIFEYEFPMFSALIACFIWIPYFNISKRVKEIFVTRLPEHEAEEFQEDKEIEAIAGF